jgi:hypothetical protein
LGERLFRKQRVGGSIPSLGSKLFEGNSRLDILYGRPLRSKYHPLSMMAALRLSVLWWFRVVGLRLLQLELRSLRFRIQQQWKRRLDALYFEAVRETVPPLCACESPIESNSYIAGIRTLRVVRPWLTLYDYELFLQGWFQAEKCASRIGDTESHRECRTLVPPGKEGVS